MEEIATEIAKQTLSILRSLPSCILNSGLEMKVRQTSTAWHMQTCKGKIVAIESKTLISRKERSPSGSIGRRSSKRFLGEKSSCGVAVQEFSEAGRPFETTCLNLCTTNIMGQVNFYFGGLPEHPWFLPIKCQ